MTEGQGPLAYPDSDITFMIGTLHDGRVLLDFGKARVDHLKLTSEQALELAEGLVEATREASKGRTILPDGSPFERGK